MKPGAVSLEMQQVVALVSFHKQQTVDRTKLWNWLSGLSNLYHVKVLV
jgi:hypothetical protein